MNVLEEWIGVAAAELGLEPGDVQHKVVLDVARDVAHNVVRPGAPVTAYLMGLAVGRGADPAEAAARISALALAWPAGDAPAEPRSETQPETQPEGAKSPETTGNAPADRPE